MIFKNANNDTCIADAAPDGSWVEITQADLTVIHESRRVQPDTDAIVSTFEAAVQAHLDAFAATWRYESILSAASYASSTVPSFKAEALALIAWRDQVWAQCYVDLDAVQAGTLAMPASPAAFIATLPASPARP